MKHCDFHIGTEFECGGKRWRCTDIGTRVIVAICLTNELSITHRERDGWFNGPPYAVAEFVFDEDDILACEKS